MKKFKKGDIVTRKSYGNDITFYIKQIIKIPGNEIAILCGLFERIEADSSLNDLELLDENTVRNILTAEDNRLNSRIQNKTDNFRFDFIDDDSRLKTKIITGKILHLDGDRRYSQKSYNYYKKVGLNAIVKNIPVEVTYPSKEELREMDYRSKIEIEGQVRIVTIPGYDVCACCAPHVARTGEIGMLKVMTLQNYKGGVRISMLCGFRALEAFREKASIVSELMGIFSTNQDAIVDNVQKLKGTVQSLKSELGTAGQKLLEYQLKEIPQDQQQVIVFEENMDANVMRNAVNKLTETHPGYCGIFAGNDNDGYRFIVGSTTKDCRELAGIMKEKLGSRGGGGNRMIQGSVERKRACILSFFEQL